VLDPSWRSQAEGRGLQTVSFAEMPSMIIAGEGATARSQLAELKAVDAGYPLRGALMLRAGAASVAVRGGPPPGTAWVDDKLVTALQLTVGDSIRLGEAHFTVTHVIASEPDRPAMMAFQPRVMIARADLDATGLVQPGSFADYGLLVAGDKSAVGAYETWLKAALKKVDAKRVHIDTLATRNATVNQALERADSFLSLVGLLSALLASVAVAMAARRFTERHADASAMLKCLGMRQSRVTMLYLLEFTVVGMLASAIGVLCGFGAHFVLLEWLGSLLTTELAPASWLPALSGLGVGTLLLVGFGMPPLLQLRNVSHNRLMRREAEATQPRTLLAYAAGLVMFGGVMLWQTGELAVGLTSLAAFVACMALFALVAWGFVACLRFVPAALDRGVLRLALADMRRRRAASVTQIVSLALGLMALLLLTVVRGDLLDAWKNSAPLDAPNQIIAKIEQAQRAAVEARLRQFGSPVVAPRILARLDAVNGRAVDKSQYKEGPAKYVADSEIEISSATALPGSDTLVGGRWFANGAHELSLSDEVAKAMRLKLGDRMRLAVAGATMELPITSLRKIDRRSRVPTFSLIISPAAAAGLPATYFAAVHVPAADKASMTRLSQDYPNLIVFDYGAMVALLQSMLDQVSAAVEFLFLFTLASGVLVLYATLLASQAERVRQGAVLRMLGASRRQMARAQHLEYALTGALAGLLAACGATLASWALARFVFKFAWTFSPILFVFGLLAGALCALAGGWAALRAVLNQPPLQSLRTN